MAHPRRGARRAAPLVLLAAVAVASACSSAGAHRTAATGTTATAPAPTATPNAAAARLLARAEAALSMTRSFRFDAVETVDAKTRLTTRIDGSVVRGQGVSYTFTVGRTQTEVVRVLGATYVRQLPGQWARLHKPRPVADPTASLAAILRGLTNPVLATPTRVLGTLSPAGAKAAGISSGGVSHVAVAVDRNGRVTQVALATTVTAGKRIVAVTLTTSYSAFDATPRLRRPQ